jgi:CDP-diacylglycerol--serine O-phosphatidyltransferase
MPISDLKPKSGSGNDSLPMFVGIHRLVPNLVTLTAMASGIAAIQFSFNEQWDRAVLAILVAVILDAMDGAIARLLKAQSEFGAQLDSLSDFLSFGVAPAIILYAWILEDSGKLGWMAMIVYAACAALRLARFNVAQKALPKWKTGFFSGVPSPAGAGLALLPLIVWIQSPDTFEQFAFASPLVGLWMILVGGLMVSRIPTFSTKMIRLPAKMAMPLMAFAVFIIAALFHAPWQTLTILSIMYIISIPFGIRHFQKLQKEHADDEQMSDLAIGALALDDLSEQDKDD